MTLGEVDEGQHVGGHKMITTFRQERISERFVEQCHAGGRGGDNKHQRSLPALQC